MYTPPNLSIYKYIHRCSDIAFLSPHNAADENKILKTKNCIEECRRPCCWVYFYGSCRRRRHRFGWQRTVHFGRGAGGEIWQECLCVRDKRSRQVFFSLLFAPLRRSPHRSAVVRNIAVLFYSSLRLVLISRSKLQRGKQKCVGQIKMARRELGIPAAFAV